MHKAEPYATPLLAGSGGCGLLLGFLLLAGQTRLATLGKLGDFDVPGGSCRFGDYRRRRTGHFAIFFFLLLFGHECPRKAVRAPSGGVAAAPQLRGNYLILLWLGGTGGWVVPMEVVLNLDFLAGQNDPSPPDITGTHIVFTDNVGVRCQHRNRPTRLVSQTVVRLINRLGTVHQIGRASCRERV